MPVSHLPRLTRMMTMAWGLMLGIQAGPAVADSCRDALDRFDYPAARAEASRQLDGNPANAAAWVCLARSQYETGHFADALASLARTEGLAMEGPTRVLADNWYGVTLRRLGRRAEAWEHLGRALDLAQTVRDTGGLATALHNRAGMLYDADQAEMALSTYRQSLAINPDQAERSASLNNMGLIEIERGNFRQGETHILAAIDLNRSHGHAHHLGKHLMNLGNLYRIQGRFEAAERHLLEGASLVAKAGDQFWLGVSHRLLAWLARDRRDLPRAASELEAAIGLYQSAGTPVEAEAAKAELAGLRQRPGQP